MKTTKTTKTTAGRSIVRAKDFNGFKGVLFLMDADDPRFGTDNYEIVTGGKYESSRWVVGHNGFSVRVFVGDDGSRWHVYPDWSVRKAN